MNACSYLVILYLSDLNWSFVFLYPKQNLTNVLQKCCVSDCPSYGPPSVFFHFPTNSEQRIQWLQKIPRINWVVDHSTVICSRHFQPHELKQQHGKVELFPDAIPTLFPVVPNNSNDTSLTYDDTTKDMFEIPERDSVPETFGELEQMTDYSDLILDFNIFTTKYFIVLEEELRQLNWISQVTANFAFFYQTAIGGLNEDIRIISSVKITQDLKVTIALGGVIVDPLDVTRFLPISSKIIRWSQLRNILIEFGRHEVKAANYPNFVIVDPKQLSIACNQPT